MKIYKTKHWTVQAIQYTGDNINAIYHWADSDQHFVDRAGRDVIRPPHQENIRFSAGDFIVKNEHGYISALPADVFERHYEPYNEE